MKSVIRTAALVASLFAFAATAHAQTSRNHLGFHGGYNFDLEEFALGVQFSTPIDRRLEFYPSFDYYFVDFGSLWQLNADLKYRAWGQHSQWIYVGAGVNVSRYSLNNFHNSETGANLLAGFESLRGKVHPFGEFRVMLHGDTQTQLNFGLNFTLGRH